MSFVTTAQKLKLLLANISASVLPVSYEYAETLPSSFPAGMILLQGSPTERFVDSANNELTMVFVIRTVYPQEEGSAAFEKWLGLLDALGTEFRKKTNLTLTGTVNSIQITGYGQTFSATDFSQPVAIFDVQVTAKVLKSIV